MQRGQRDSLIVDRDDDAVVARSSADGIRSVDLELRRGRRRRRIAALRAALRPGASAGSARTASGTPCGSKHSSRSATATITPGTFHERPQMKRTRCGARMPATGSPFSARATAAGSGCGRRSTRRWDSGRRSFAVASVVAIMAPRFRARRWPALRSSASRSLAPSAIHRPQRLPSAATDAVERGAGPASGESARARRGRRSDSTASDWPASRSTSNSSLSSYSVIPPPVATKRIVGARIADDGAAGAAPPDDPGGAADLELFGVEQARDALARALDEEGHALHVPPICSARRRDLVSRPLDRRTGLVDGNGGSSGQRSSAPAKRGLGRSARGAEPGQLGPGGAL